MAETSEGEDVNMSDIMNPADEEDLLALEDEHGGSEDEIQNGQKSPSTVNERPVAKEQPPRISRDRKRPSSEKSATEKFRPRDGTPSQREDKEIKSIKGKIESWAEALKKLQVHVDDGTCPRTLRDHKRVNIAADEELKREVSSIRKKAERQIVTSLVKFHQRRTERLSIKLGKLQQTKSSRKDTARNVNLAQPSTSVHSAPRTRLRCQKQRSRSWTQKYTKE